MLVTFQTKELQKEAFKKALLADLEGAKKEPGNISMALFEDKKDPTILYFFERWKSKTALDFHFEQSYTKAVLTLSEKALAKPMQILYLNDLAPLPTIKDEPAFIQHEVDLVVLFDVKKGMEDRFVRQFQKSVQHSRPEAGCKAFHIHSVNDQATTFVLYERWTTQEALDFHFEQWYTKELFQEFKEVLHTPVEKSLHFLQHIK
jgi:quinol monooxygenase YgiN